MPEIDWREAIERWRRLPPEERRRIHLRERLALLIKRQGDSELRDRGFKPSD